MPIISVGRDKLFAALGKEYSELDAQVCACGEIDQRKSSGARECCAATWLAYERVRTLPHSLLTAPLAHAKKWLMLVNFPPHLQPMTNFRSCASIMASSWTMWCVAPCPACGEEGWAGGG